MRHHDINTDFLAFRHFNCTRSCDSGWHLDSDFLVNQGRYFSLDLNHLGHGDPYLDHHVNSGRHLGSDRLSVLLGSADLHRYICGHVHSVIHGDVVLLVELYLSGHLHVLVERLAGLGSATAGAGVEALHAGATGLAGGDNGHSLGLVDGFGHRAPRLLAGDLLLLCHLRLHLGHRDHSDPLNVLLHVYHLSLLAWLLLLLPLHTTLLHHLLNHFSFLDSLHHWFVYNLLLSDLLLHHHTLILRLLHRFHHRSSDLPHLGNHDNLRGNETLLNHPRGLDCPVLVTLVHVAVLPLMPLIR